MGRRKCTLFLASDEANSSRIAVMVAEGVLNASECGVGRLNLAGREGRAASCRLQTEPRRNSLP